MVATQAASPMLTTRKCVQVWKWTRNWQEHCRCWCYCSILHNRWRLALAQGCHAIHTGRQPITKVKRLADLVHLSQTKVKWEKKRTFGLKHFPGMTAKEDGQEWKCVLTADLQRRSSMILKHKSEKVQCRYWPDKTWNAFHHQCCTSVLRWRLQWLCGKVSMNLCTRWQSQLVC